MFYAPWFAIAGLVAAAGPVLIHLLNRQRYRVVEWAAMEFLRQAIHRSRRWLRLRDLLLLVVRTACIVAFGLALAQPYRLAAPAAADPNQPVHAVFLVDNSLSMGYQQLGRTLLDEAKDKISEVIQQLPPGSVISIVPLAGHRRLSGPEPAYRTKQDALEALETIEVVDRQATVVQAIDLARQACTRVAQPTLKQILLITDYQALGWRVGSLEEDLKRLPGTLQVLRLGPENRENAWVETLEVLDGVADVKAPTVFLTRIRYVGQAPRHDVQVSLLVEGSSVAVQRLSLLPGQTAEVQFPPYRFQKPVEPGQVVFVPVEVQISADRLPLDDRRSLAVPVAAGLPVVFVDSMGKAEEPRLGRYGETYRLRRLLAPGAVRGTGQSLGTGPASGIGPSETRTAQPELIEVRHVDLGQLESEGRRLLQDARAVVMAGLPSPGSAVPLLREYVQQGGTLLIAAGGQFDPQAWNQSAWLDGLGILPAPLKPQPVGRTPQETLGRLDPFFLDFSSLIGDYFFIEHEPEETLKEIYSRVFFFKAVAVDDSAQVRQQLLQNLARYWEKHQAEVQQIAQQLAQLRAKPSLTEADRQRRLALQERLDQLQPHWLLWAEAAFGPPVDPLLGDRVEPAPSDTDTSPGPIGPGSRSGSVSSGSQAAPAALPERVLQQMAFSTLARYTKDRLPFLIERPLGRGQLLFVSSGVFRDWNNMTTEYAVVVFDRILRRALQRSIARRNLSTTESLVIPVPAAQRSASILLTDPDGQTDTLSVEALAADRYGIRIPPLAVRGVWRLTAAQSEDLLTPLPGGTGSNGTGFKGSTPGLVRLPTSSVRAEGKLWDTPLAVNGPAEESDLTPISDQQLLERTGSVPIVLRQAEQTISVTGAAILREDYWRWFLAAVLVGLAVEAIVLAWPVVRAPTGG
ncbi:MAG: BatA domain-containing protein [Thermoguttaceae bacterium]|nr:BatA domain-containing protein [Thermoguttaceae bacterium]MDW8039647.1 BatA domain-containing protein [Thermoguttaceae bacterium]